MPNLQISLFGSFQVSLDGEPVIAFTSQKGQALLAFLAVEENRPHQRETLAGLFWPEQRDSAARHNLRQTLLKVRQAIPPDYLLSTPQTIQTNPQADHRLDVAAFSRLLTACQQHPHPDLIHCPDCMVWIQQAVDLYRTDFLAHFSMGDSPVFEEWMLLKREELRREALQALYHLAAYHQNRDDYETAYDYAWRQVALDPLREEAHRQLMSILASSGRRSEALAQYKTCRRILTDELGVEPSLETTALYERICNTDLSRGEALGDSTAKSTIAPLFPRPSAPLHNLPVQSTSFVGRQTELAELTQLLNEPAVRLVTILGLGGTGKTRLALATATTQLDHFSHGVYFVSLAPLSEPEAIISAIAEAVDYPFQSDGRSPQQQVLDYLHQKQILLILDNFEHLLDGVELVTGILQIAPKVKILATSRERLQLRQEHRYPLHGLDVLEQGGPESGGVAAAVELFVQSARRVQPNFEVSARESPHLSRICHLVEGMPLALELAAVWVEVLPLADIATEIAAEIGQSLDFLETELRDVPVRHRSIAGGPSPKLDVQNDINSSIRYSAIETSYLISMNGRIR